ncbi:MAG: hypothetical protein U1E65_29715 [Myxococcota bacterium]
MKRHLTSLPAACAIFALGACGNTPVQVGGDSGIPGADGGQPQDDAGMAGGCETTKFTWTKVDVDAVNMSTGYMPTIKVAPDGRIGIAYLEQAGAQGTCDRPAGMPSHAPIARWAVRYAESTNGGTSFTTETVGELDSLAITGAGLSFDASSNPIVSYNGGMQAPLRCGGTDVITMTKMGATWTMTGNLDDSMGTPVFPDDCAAAQGLCDFGMAIGEWITTTMVNGQLAILYRDMHGGFAQDDLRKADTELFYNGAHTTLDGTGGGGNYSAITSDGQNHIHAVSMSDGLRPGIWAFRYDGAMWTRKKIFDFQNGAQSVGYRLGLSTYMDRVSVAFHSSHEQKLRFIDSADNGVTWAAPEVVDQNGNTGRTPSLNFSPSGEPSIAYHMCGPYDPNRNDCPQDMDALRFAVKHNNVWCSQDVEANRGGEDGAYLAFAYDANGAPYIAYQAVFFDAATNMVTRKLKLARGTK